MAWAKDICAAVALVALVPAVAIWAPVIRAALS